MAPLSLKVVFVVLTSSAVQLVAQTPSQRTPEFWNSMDMIGGKSSYWLGGSFGDGKGEPSRSNSVSHGCVPARFRNVNIVNTGRRA